jgi:hypothetical protein
MSDVDREDTRPKTLNNLVPLPTLDVRTHTPCHV